MKLKKGIIFITANVVNKRILCVFSIILFIMSSHAQVKELSMELELLNVSRSNIHPSPQGGIIGRNRSFFNDKQIRYYCIIYLLWFFDS